MKLFLSTILISFLLASCAAKYKNDALYQSLIQGQSEAGKRLQVENTNWLLQLKEGTRDVRTGFEACIWLPKAERAHTLVETFNRYLDSLKSTLGEMQERAAVQHLFQEQEKATELALRLQNFQHDFLANNVENQQLFEEGGRGSFLLISNEDWRGWDGNRMYERYLEGASPEAAQAWLGQIQNNLLRIENQFLQFSLESALVPNYHGDWLHDLLTQSSRYVKKGDTLTIEAGLAYFPWNVRAELRVNQHLIVNPAGGLFRYQTTISQSPGTYRIPVSFAYMDQDGIRRTKEDFVTYTVLP